LFFASGLFLSAQNGVIAYKIVYETIDPFNARTTASGAVIVPTASTKALPLASYQHGTVTLKSDVPSAMNDDFALSLVLGGTGYVACAPDYIGLGDSPGLHPYHHAKTEATAAIDLLRAARTLCLSNSVALNGQLFIVGYSQGGHATMALHRELEASHSNEFTITASAPMAGAYDMSGVTTTDFLSGRSVPNPYYYAYLLAAYQSVYHITNSLSDMLVSPFNVTLPPLFDGQHSGSDINQAMGTSVPTNILKPDVLSAFKSNPNHPLRFALQDNDVYDWTPRAPMQMYHCHADQDVLFANSQVAYDSFIAHGATQVRLIDPSPSSTHGTCAPFALLQAKGWFDSLKK